MNRVNRMNHVNHVLRVIHVIHVITYFAYSRDSRASRDSRDDEQPCFGRYCCLDAYVVFFRRGQLVRHQPTRHSTCQSHNNNALAGQLTHHLLRPLRSFHSRHKYKCVRAGTCRKGTACIYVHHFTELHHEALDQYERGIAPENDALSRC